MVHTSNRTYASAIFVEQKLKIYHVYNPAVYPKVQRLFKADECMAWTKPFTKY